MDIERIAEKLKEMIIGEIKEEFREFRASVTGELAGYRVAIESMNARISALESRQANLEAEIRDIRRALDETNKRIDETNKRIDDLRVELKTEIMLNTQRIDETNKRIDSLFIEVSHIRGDLNKALSQKEVIDDILVRLQRLEEKVLEAS